jgi:hypothetical protein
MKSNDSPAKGTADAFPKRKSIFTPAFRAFSVAILTNVRLMSKLKKAGIWMDQDYFKKDQPATASTAQPSDVLPRKARRKERATPMNQAALRLTYPHHTSTCRWSPSDSPWLILKTHR